MRLDVAVALFHGNWHLRGEAKLDLTDADHGFEDGGFDDGE